MQNHPATILTFSMSPVAQQDMAEWTAIPKRTAFSWLHTFTVRGLLWLTLNSAICEKMSPLSCSGKLLGYWTQQYSLPPSCPHLPKMWCWKCLFSCTNPPPNLFTDAWFWPPPQLTQTEKRSNRALKLKMFTLDLLLLQYFPGICLEKKMWEEGTQVGGRGGGGEGLNGGGRQWKWPI